MIFNSIKFKISILYTFILGIILIVFSSFLYFSLQYTLYKDIDHELSSKALAINKIINTYRDVTGKDEESFSFVLKRIIRIEGKHPKAARLKKDEVGWLKLVDKFDLRQDIIAIFDKNGRLLVNSRNLTGKNIEKYRKKVMVKNKSCCVGRLCPHIV